MKKKKIIKLLEDCLKEAYHEWDSTSEDCAKISFKVPIDMREWDELKERLAVAKAKHSLLLEINNTIKGN